ncbi:hypothetical protein CTAYLR_001995 [Chrysophaeum taylorii]|uniref:Letm1 RBD domain-containing protein n=1 Tax=Chrysophaeum taylorii TaxID=2483200 RepID=A0AAD7UA82_9STRA|nr:hypothetical protein CTAYLR_001995 [Chrysophaeum taylorii]
MGSRRAQMKRLVLWVVMAVATSVVMATPSYRRLSSPGMTLHRRGGMSLAATTAEDEDAVAKKFEAEVEVEAEISESSEQENLASVRQMLLADMATRRVVRRQQPREEKTGILRAYFAGAQRLWSEVAMWRQLRVARKSRSLTWREQLVMNQLPTHLGRMLPILVNPLPPPFGFILIGLASAVPRYLLTPQFWTFAQLERFSAADARNLRKMFSALLRSCSTRLYVSSDALTTTPLVALVDLFDGPLALESLDRTHLKRLARAARMRVAWLPLAFVRTSRLRRALRIAAAKTALEDDALAADFHHLEPRHLFHACAQRGLRVDGDDHDRGRRLRAWLEAREALIHANRARRDGLPPSFALHMPAIFAALIDQTEP